jgi:DegV family protein with EDD domain
MPKTAAVNPEQWAQRMEPALSRGEDVLILSFSSGLSTTYQSAVIAATELREKYPGRKILVVDTTCASVGHGLVVWHAARLRDEGKTIDQVYQWVEENAPCVHHWVTVNDLMHLKRGGRVSATTALVGTMLQIKPIIHVTAEGKLDTVAKARGRKAAMNYLVEKMEELGTPGANDTVIVGHGDCGADAGALAEMVKERCGVKNVIVSYVGNVIGSHTGPDVLVVAFLGTRR